MKKLDEHVLKLLTASWETGSNLISDLRNEPRCKLEWKPADVLDALNRLCATGKAEYGLEGYRLLDASRAKPERQKSIFDA